MPLNKAKGNMYDFVTHCHSHLGGECPHRCCYCYVQRNRFGVSERYKGEPRLIENELAVNYGSGKIIFIEHMSDLFACDIKGEWIKRIIGHCLTYNQNKYVFQTKNPARFNDYIDLMPDKCMLGVTMETNREFRNDDNSIKISQAPRPIKRYEGIMALQRLFPVFITLEPILDMDIDIMVEWMINIKPDFINIGADSKECGLPEPSAEKIRELIARLQENNLVIRKKSNLERILAI